MSGKAPGTRSARRSAARSAVVLAAALLPGVAAGQRAPGFDGERFHETVEAAVGDWGATGLAVAVVRGGEVLFERGYGVLEMGRSEPVTPDTLFAIGSTTKAMAAATVGILVDEGNLGWDDPVRRHIPEFEVADPWVSAGMTVRDLLTHRGGLPNTDAFWYGQETSTTAMLERLRGVAPAYPMRGGFVYQNVMYALAGEVVARASGMPWHEFLRARILAPLGMERTAPLLSEARERSNVASPHFLVDGELTVIENASVDAVASAGSVWSSVREMSLWLRMLLRGGVGVDGARVLPEAVVAGMFRPQALVDRATFYPTQNLTRPKWVTYGLGWFQQDYAGRAVDFHTGSIDGMVAIAGLIREEDIGVMVLGNLDHVEVRHALMLLAFDRLLGRPGRDWSSELKALYDGLAAEQADAVAAALGERNPDAAPSLELPSFAGTYRDAVGGEIRVTLREGDSLFLDYGPGLRGTLEPWRHNTFLVRWEARWRGESLVSFPLDILGRPSVLTFGATEFRRRPE